jgi:hypothetical protein
VALSAHLEITAENDEVTVDALPLPQDQIIPKDDLIVWQGRRKDGLGRYQHHKAETDYQTREEQSIFHGFILSPL